MREATALTVIAYGLAAVVALERVDSGAHWPSDVFVGAMAGVAIAKTVVHRNQDRRAVTEVQIGARESGPVLFVTRKF